MTTLHSLQLRTLTGFHFTHEEKHRLVLILLTVRTEILITLCITIRDEHNKLFSLR